jgi:ABC-type branched-subunit amino acid transport system ATPase component
MTAARRARLGLGRTFQGAELFGDLDVRETVALAFEGSERTGIASVMLALPRAGRAESAKRLRADEIVAFLGLDQVADRFVSELSTGTRRIVELACLIASGAVLCLDEPTAGLAQPTRPEPSDQAAPRRFCRELRCPVCCSSSTTCRSR